MNLIIVNSKTLSKHLKSVVFINDTYTDVVCANDKIELRGVGVECCIYSKYSFTATVDGKSFNMLKKFLDFIEEQPITLGFTHDSIIYIKEAIL